MGNLETRLNQGEQQVKLVRNSLIASASNPWEADFVSAVAESKGPATLSSIADRVNNLRISERQRADTIPITPAELAGLAEFFVDARIVRRSRKGRYSLTQLATSHWATFESALSSWRQDRPSVWQP